MDNLHKTYGYHKDDASCRKRIKLFKDRSKLYIADVRFSVRRNLPSEILYDHLTVWYDDDDRAFFMVELYGSQSDHAKAFNASTWPWILVPMRFAPYGNGTSTYLFTFPRHNRALSDIKSNLE